MKIFFWSKVRALRQYADGMVIALAPSKEVALSRYGSDDSQDHERDLYERHSALEKELRSKEPEVFNGSKPYAFLIPGSA